MSEKEAIMSRLSPGQIMLAEILAEAFKAKQRARATHSDRSNNENSNLRPLQLRQTERNLPH